MKESSEINISTRIIQKYWKKRVLKKNVMYALAEQFYERECINMRTFNLIDEWFDTHVHILIDKYNTRANKLKIMSYDSYCLSNKCIID